MVLGAGLAERLREGTRAAHGLAEETVYMRCFTQGVVGRGAFRQWLMDLYGVYRLLEGQMGELAATEPAIAGIQFPELWRTAAIAADLEFYWGPDWEALVQPSEAGTVYLARLGAVAWQQPELLVAHAYVRYMGDLSGGQGLKAMARKALNLPEDRGTQFHTFDALPTVEAQRAFKGRYREALNGLPLTEAQIQAIVAEANLAFHLNCSLMRGLEPLLKSEVDPERWRGAIARRAGESGHAPALVGG